MNSSFWGLVVEPENTYTQTVGIPFRLSNASLSSNLASKERSSLTITVDDKKFVLCSLTPGKIEQQSIDLTLNEGENVTFEIDGKNEFHLVGNYIEYEDDEYSDEDDSDDSEDGDYSIEDSMYLDDLDDSDEMDYDYTEIEESDGRIKEIVDSSEEETELPVVKPTKIETSEETNTTTSKNKKRKKNKANGAETSKTESQQENGAKQPAAQESQKTSNNADAPKKRKLAGGLTAEDKKEGSGPPIQKGQRVGMYYIGKLASNGKQFDSCTKGKPFWFTLGSGEVIKGWDVGIAGMRKGGERRLTIPASMGYGSRGAPPDIPGNATLVFDVRVAEVKK
ncbi:hypothetical protein BB560_002563 [Smittium megazygosporum]|uniref:peptidylprolyl isomerase n=1 Tax=Smittium megazygosporum TaxID=133381 RepID=A0A2T9ZEG6_9FUNG|nr:hypothetical protein BB560_002563 [Smittium megazygosporum]